MADNVGYTPGTGSKVATRDVTYSGESANAQAVGLVTFAGADDAKTATDVSEANPLPVAAYGELIEAVEAMRMAINSLTKTIGYALPNLQGQPIFEARQATAANLNVTASGTVTANQGGTWNITTLTNQSQIGGFAANDEIPALMHLQVDGLRRNISVT
ncbi:hypothetical protein [Phenylobacterium sp.]|uniref:hypothetical protein n=1 Tax=Phenylobacterium sp. TaxID=1871053 RepID=UPI0025EFD053|nr:hypothetical protein [Phenylobacterium sp.]MCA3505086.1 hypothetical protein [Rhodobacter sp.]MCA3733572.1 hypothetical protein [Phenylobacterium sp.]MCA6276605.1 hypothetical protein [Phenylobacterium sp.]MCA6295649.1 hypothetical protein [Phenylobacterium sp.]MCA6360585.1 hypothetical protein [Phenylobacterium sp.]